MNKKFLAAAFLVFSLVLTTTLLQAYEHKFGKTKGEGWSFEDKFNNKAHLMLANKAELGLSTDQIKNIKDLKNKTQKNLIKQDAEINIIALDVKAEMHKDPMDVNAINKLIDKKYDLKKEKAKSLVSSCAELKSILTKEQNEKMKEIYKKCEKGKTHSLMKGRMSCPMMGGNE